MATPHLLGLPLEVRNLIYSHLCPPEPVCYPFPSAPITSISHRPPPLNLLLTCRHLCSEAVIHFHSTATFRFLALPVARGKDVAMHATALAGLRKAHRVEFMLMWNITEDRARVHWRTWPWWMVGWLDMQLQLLQDEAEELKVVVVSLRDASVRGWWEVKQRLLDPLDRLKGKVRFEVGEIVTEEQEVWEGIRRKVRELNA